ncbi:MAG: Fe-S-containing protein [Bacteroidota bacterium]
MSRLSVVAIHEKLESVEMLESFLITVREGIEIALIIGILLAYLERVGKPFLKKTVYAGLVASAIVSVFAAIILERLAIDYESLEGYLMFTAAAFVTTMIVWMWRSSRHIKREIEERVTTLLAEKTASWQLLSGVFLFTFLMVVREGVETVIFLRAVSSAGGWSSGTIGALGGILVAIGFGTMFVKGSLRIDIGRFLKVTAIVLLIFVAQLVINGVHEFYELGVFPANPRMMGIVGPIVRNNLLFILAILSIPAIMFIIPGTRKSAPPSRASRSWQLAAGLVSLSVIFFLGFDDVFTTRSSAEISPAEQITAEAGEIRLSVADLLDGKLHRFMWVDDAGARIRFFALRTGTGTFSTAFDACRACYNYGYYYLNNGELTCSICEAPSELSKLAMATGEDAEQSGSMEGMGCAPLYLPSRMLGESILIKTSELEKNKKYFQTNLEEKVSSVVPSHSNKTPN